jgi:hypothetical protein
MYALFIVLVAGTPIFGVAFATCMLGLGLPRWNVSSGIGRLAQREMHALGRTAGDVSQQCENEARHSPCDRRVSSHPDGSWRQVLGLPLNEHRRSVAHQAYRALARANHPDLSGSNAAMQRINDAWKQAKRELILK